MSIKRTPTPWDFEINDGDLNDDHALISVAAAYDPGVQDKWTEADLIAAAVWVTGVMSRAALVLLHDLELERHRHHCARFADPCSLTFNTLAMTYPTQHAYNLNSIEIVVPIDNRAAWAARIRDTVQLVAADTHLQGDEPHNPFQAIPPAGIA